jgi:hypothetical protein
MVRENIFVVLLIVGFVTAMLLVSSSYSSKPNPRQFASASIGGSRFYEWGTVFWSNGTSTTFNATGMCDVNSALSLKNGYPVSICNVDASITNDPTIVYGTAFSCPGGSGWRNNFVTFPSPFAYNLTGIAIAGLFDWSDYGHLENPLNAGSGGAFGPSGFWYRTQLSSSGCWGVSFTAASP